VAAVLAEAAGVSEDRSFDVAARAQAKRMRGIRHDWAGRPTCTWSAAAELLASLRAEQARVLAEIEQEAIEADEAFRAQLWTGLSADHLPIGVSPAAAMFAADKELTPRRESVLEHALANDGSAVYHPIREESS
jgi:hypothetical protein